MPTFKNWTPVNTHSCFYLRRASAGFLLVGSYPTTWGREELNLQCLPLGNAFTVRCNTTNRCRFPITATRRLAIMFFVPCVALGIQNADYSQTIDRLQANSIIWPLRQARIRTLHYRLQKRCGYWLRMIARLPLGNTLTDRFLYLQYPFCHCLTIWGNYIFDSSGTVG